MSHDQASLAAAELADRYIEIVLSTKPDLLVYAVANAKPEDIPRYAQKLASFRQQLINELQAQPIPKPPSGD